MNSKALFFDIDGTLEMQGSPIVPSTIDALKRVKENGHRIFICTGRSRSMIFNSLVDGLGFDGVIGGCGTYCEYQKEIISNKELTREETDYIINVLKQYDVTYIFEGKVNLYYNDVPLQNKERLYVMQMIEAQIKERLLKVEEVNGSITANKFSCYVNSGDEDEVFQEFEHLYDSMRHRKNTAEFIPKGYNKATGIQEMCKYLQIDSKDTFAFGDSVNDVAMLDYCEVGVVMGNGSEIAKEHGNYITANIENGGIYQACKHFGLL